jgi:predicted GH43/DUF377 family glycosyl hydrolase
MKWRKLGRVWAPDGTLWWARSYALLPTVEIIGYELVRVYFASLDHDRYGRVGFLDLDASDPLRVLAVHERPVLDVGPLGAFDDSGVNPSCVVTTGGRRALYYIGWQRCSRVPYMLFSGLAVWSDEKGAFCRQQETPVLDRNIDEPFSRAAPFVLPVSGGFRAWYWSCVEWTEGPEGVHYNNVIRTATSTDGRVWDAETAVCLEPAGGAEYSLGRPWVVRGADRYHMWFSARSFGRRYVIGYAESHDGVVWTRRDDLVGISASSAGWDSEMICYPCVVDLLDRRYMFYNGNRHGSTGFGVAVLEED